MACGNRRRTEYNSWQEHNGSSFNMAINILSDCGHWTGVGSFMFIFGVMHESQYQAGIIGGNPQTSLVQLLTRALITGFIPTTGVNKMIPIQMLRYGSLNELAHQRSIRNAPKHSPITRIFTLGKAASIF